MHMWPMTDVSEAVMADAHVTVVWLWWLMAYTHLAAMAGVMCAAFMTGALVAVVALMTSALVWPSWPGCT